MNTLHPLGRAVLSLSLLLAVAACAGPADEPPADAGSLNCLNLYPDEIPPPSKPCLAGCGNELGVGQPCTKGSGECSGFQPGEAIFCTVDFEDTDYEFCTLACVRDEQCGSGARCAVDPESPGSPAGCVLNACAPLTDAGPGSPVDAG